MSPALAIIAADEKVVLIERLMTAALIRSRAAHCTSDVQRLHGLSLAEKIEADVMAKTVSSAGSAPSGMGGRAMLREAAAAPPEIDSAVSIQERIDAAALKRLRERAA